MNFWWNLGLLSRFQYFYLWLSRIFSLKHLQILMDPFCLFFFKKNHLINLLFFFRIWWREFKRMCCQRLVWYDGMLRHLWICIQESGQIGIDYFVVDFRFVTLICAKVAWLKSELSHSISSINPVLSVRSFHKSSITYFWRTFS